MRYFSLIVTGISVCCVIVACTIGMERTAQRKDVAGNHIPPAAMEHYSTVPTDIDTSAPDLILRIAFKLAGHDLEEAIELTDKVMEEFFGKDVVAPLDWKNTDHHATLAEAYEIAGYESSEAVLLATLAMMFFAGELPPDKPLPQSEEEFGELFGGD